MNFPTADEWRAQAVDGVITDNMGTRWPVELYCEYRTRTDALAEGLLCDSVQSEFYHRERIHVDAIYGNLRRIALGLPSYAEMAAMTEAHR